MLIFSPYTTRTQSTDGVGRLGLIHPEFNPIQVEKNHRDEPSETLVSVLESLGLSDSEGEPGCLLKKSREGFLITETGERRSHSRLKQTPVPQCSSVDLRIIDLKTEINVDDDRHSARRAKV